MSTDFGSSIIYYHRPEFEYGKPNLVEKYGRYESFYVTEENLELATRWDDRVPGLLKRGWPYYRLPLYFVRRMYNNVSDGECGLLIAYSAGVYHGRFRMCEEFTDPTVITASRLYDVIDDFHNSQK